MPAEILQAVAGALPAAAATGVRLPALHRYAPDFTAGHRNRPAPGPLAGPSSAASWLRRGPPSPTLLAALDRVDLIGAPHDVSALAREAAGHTEAAPPADPVHLKGVAEGPASACRSGV
ncbi:hypothetical protein [Streptomyces roseolus]|uniref:hypothetical protein n=1 Tax=Streptomyces roseolus TaxID=67358 RepID=UPI00378C801D